ncbi:hypothetical protein [Flavobacterium sp. UBA7682]|uniref:hypothetical protein n=1 Tax=Flavobacterium sp. UBA7682 TaxID=1946560 RepID=UPI0025BCABF1|nr:hypothetical protein [Flavobacterium sp. UBA7682]
MKIFFYFLLGLILVALTIDVYSYFNEGFFWTPISKIVNISTPVFLFIYLLIWFIKEKNEAPKQ